MAIKTYKDYIDELHKSYPYLTSESIENILVFGLKIVNYILKYNHEIYMKTKGFFMYIIHYNSAKDQRRYSSARRQLKVRFLYNFRKDFKAINKFEIDNFRWVRLTDSLYENFLKTGIIDEQRGYYLAKEEANMMIGGNHLIKVPFKKDDSFAIFLNEYNKLEHEEKHD